MIGTREYWISEYHEFRKLMQNKNVMGNIEMRDNALRGFITLWMMTNDAKEQDEITMNATIDEFNRRCVLLDIEQLEKYNEGK